MKRAISNGGKLPAFGEIPNRADIVELFDGVDAEIVTYARIEPKDLLTDTITLLHASPNIKSSTGEICAMNRFMGGCGFGVEWREGPADWPFSDMLVLDVDGCTSRQGVSATIAGAAGLMWDQDVLLYGAGYTSLDMYTGPGSPIRANRRFGSDGICMLHSYIRHRDTPPFWAGFYAYITERIEAYANQLLPANTQPLSKKLGCLEERLKQAELDGPDVRMFFAAIGVIRELRNRAAHPDTGMKKDPAVALEYAMRYFGDVAKCCKRDDIFLSQIKLVDLPYGWYRYFTRMALATQRWLGECCEMAKAQA